MLCFFSLASSITCTVTSVRGSCCHLSSVFASSFFSRSNSFRDQPRKSWRIYCKSIWTSCKNQTNVFFMKFLKIFRATLVLRVLPVETGLPGVGHSTGRNWRVGNRHHIRWCHFIVSMILNEGTIYRRTFEQVRNWCREPLITVDWCLDYVHSAHFSNHPNTFAQLGSTTLNGCEDCIYNLECRYMCKIIYI